MTTANAAAFTNEQEGPEILRCPVCGSSDVKPSTLVVWIAPKKCVQQFWLSPYGRVQLMTDNPAPAEFKFMLVEAEYHCKARHFWRIRLCDNECAIVKGAQ